jgi:hypothetical protein
VSEAVLCGQPLGVTRGIWNSDIPGCQGTVLGSRALAHRRIPPGWYSKVGSENSPCFESGMTTLILHSVPRDVIHRGRCRGQPSASAWLDDPPRHGGTSTHGVPFAKQPSATLQGRVAVGVSYAGIRNSTAAHLPRDPFHSLPHDFSVCQRATALCHSLSALSGQPFLTAFSFTLPFEDPGGSKCSTVDPVHASTVQRTNQLKQQQLTTI